MTSQYADAASKKSPKMEFLSKISSWGTSNAERKLSIAMNLRRVAKFQENGRRDVGERVFGKKT